MTKEITIDNPVCPRCEGSLTMSFSEEDDTEYIIHNEMTLWIECWECNLTGSASFKMTDIEIEDDENEDEE